MHLRIHASCCGSQAGADEGKQATVESSDWRGSVEADLRQIDAMRLRAEAPRTRAP